MIRLEKGEEFGDIEVESNTVMYNFCHMAMHVQPLGQAHASHADVVMTTATNTHMIDIPLLSDNCC